MQKIEFMGVGAESVMITGPIFFCEDYKVD